MRPGTPFIKRHFMEHVFPAGQSIRVVLVTVDGSLHTPDFVAALLEGRRGDIAAIVVPTIKHRSSGALLRLAFEALKFHGIRGFIHLCLLHLHRVALDRLGRVMPLRAFYSIRAVAERYSVPFYSCRDINAPEFLEFLSRELAPDVIVSMGNPQIFKKEALSIPRLGCINIHPSLLPGYRGSAPLFWVLANDETETGVTVHYMDEKIDNGAIILQSSMPIRTDDTMYSLYRRTMRLGVTLVLEALQRIEEGTVSTAPNCGGKASYYPLPTVDDSRRLRRKGRRII